MALAEKLYELRKKSSLSQEQLAEQLGVSRQAISKWESGQAVPESDKLVAISNYFQVSLDYLMKEEITRSETSAIETKSGKSGNERKTLGLIACIGGIVCLILWGLISMLAPSASDNIAESSMIRIDGNGIVILICIFAIVSGAFLILKGGKKNE